MRLVRQAALATLARLESLVQQEMTEQQVRRVQLERLARAVIRATRERPAPKELQDRQARRVLKELLATPDPLVTQGKRE